MRCGGWKSGDVGRVVAAGTVVIGLAGTEGELGRACLERLSVSRLLPAGIATAHLAAVIAGVGPVNAAAPAPRADRTQFRGGRAGSAGKVDGFPGGAGRPAAVGSVFRAGMGVGPGGPGPAGTYQPASHRPSNRSRPGQNHALAHAIPA